MKRLLFVAVVAGLMLTTSAAPPSVPSVLAGEQFTGFASNIVQGVRKDGTPYVSLRVTNQKTGWTGWFTCYGELIPQCANTELGSKIVAIYGTVATSKGKPPLTEMVMLAMENGSL